MMTRTIQSLLCWGSKYYWQEIMRAMAEIDTEKSDLSHNCHFRHCTVQFLTHRQCYLENRGVVNVFKQPYNVHKVLHTVHVYTRRPFQPTSYDSTALTHTNWAHRISIGISLFIPSVCIKSEYLKDNFIPSSGILLRVQNFGKLDSWNSWTSSGALHLNIQSHEPGVEGRKHRAARCNEH